MQKINYARMGAAQEFYEQDGKFQIIEVPWMVTSQVSDITKPYGLESNIVANKDKELVGSGEQSFLYLYLKGHLPKGDFQTITPCFRNEPYDLTHSKQFLKLELISTGLVDEISLNLMVEKAVDFFKTQIPDHLHNLLEVIPQEDDQFDIELSGFELGSYGIRSCQFLEWIYGTGLAEPRFSQVLQMLR